MGGVVMKNQIAKTISLLAAVALLSSCGGNGYSSSTNYDGIADIAGGAYQTNASVKNSFMASEDFMTEDAGGISGDSWEYEDNISEEAGYDNGYSNSDSSLTNSGNINTEKLVYTATSSIEVKDFNNAVSALKNKVNELNGIVQSEVYWDDAPYDFYTENYKGRKISGYKRFSTVVRIPTDSFNSFINELSNLGHVKNTNSRVSNITQQYYSSKAYLESYQNQLNVLQEMYNRTGTITEMLEIEARISEVQAEINSLTTKIQSMDMDVTYSTVTIDIEEVTEYSDTPREYKELSFLDKLTQRFQNSWNNFLNFLEDLLYFVIDIGWYIILFGAILFIWIKYCRKKGKYGVKLPKLWKKKQLGLSADTNKGDSNS